MTTCTFDEANAYAARYKNIWRGGPSVDELRAQFQDMDPGTVGTALVRMARDTDTPPSIAHLWREYRALATPANAPLPAQGCDRCDDGWTSEEYTANGHTYIGLRPCARCTAGNVTRIVAAKIDAHQREHRQAGYAPTFHQTATGWTQVDYSEPTPVPDRTLFDGEF